jgi:hypothetical protein
MKAYDEYLRLRDDWQALVYAYDAPVPMNSPAKDALYATLTNAWNRLAANEKRLAGVHCKNLYH